MTREFDVVVFGGTSFTGALVCEHLARTHSHDGLRWAMAGRTIGKLEKARADLAERVGKHVLSVPILVADSFDMPSLLAMCSRTDVVVSTVGPFLKWGTNLVDACIQTQTDYTDSTGETPWIARLIAQFDDQAAERHVRIVPSCGYDSIPSDLGVLTLLNGIRKEKPDAQLDQVTHFIGPLSGGVSGGTMSTAVEMMGMPKVELGEMVSSVYTLVPCEAAKAGMDSTDQLLPAYSELLQRWTAPFVMAQANRRYVHRSAHLANYGPNFRFAEVLSLGFVSALGVSLGMGLAGLVLAIYPLRMLAARMLPEPGTGPSRKAMESGFAMSYVHCQVEHADYLVKVHIRSDAGYLGTGRLLGETAVTLARSRDLAAQMGGILTAASCPGLGMNLVKALEDKAQTTFTFSKEQNRALIPSRVLPYGARL